MNRIAKMLALGAIAVSVPLAPVNAGDPKPKKMKLETLKKGPVAVEPAYGYLLVRLGPKGPAKTPTALAFRRIDPATNQPLEKADIADPKEYLRSLAVVLNPSRNFDLQGDAGTYVLKVYPGRWVLNNTDSTCLSLGTYTVDVKAGEVVDFGTILTSKENGLSAYPELKASKLSPDLVHFGTAMNIVMTDAVYVKPAVAGAPVPAELQKLAVKPATLGADYRFDNLCTQLVNRAASLGPIERPAPASKDQAKTMIDAINTKMGVK